ncbi:ubiquitin-like protein Pup [Kineococcus glutinatus]|uniref:Prokaryotic ubiquitin-like protein Pup n=1 Tax=Kineococcus glutinatus TaxID=1070872 RepID=A0ABP9HXR4_9ACTN
MPAHEQQRPSRREDEPEELASAPSGQTTTHDEDVDALLDEIDDVLETNSEEFVRGFVQKGGQ